MVATTALGRVIGGAGVQPEALRRGRGLRDLGARLGVHKRGAFFASGLDDDEDEGAGRTEGERGVRPRENVRRAVRAARRDVWKTGGRSDRSVCSALATRERNPRARVGGFT